MKSGERQDLDRLILDHIGRYRLTFQEILGALFFDGGSPQKRLNILQAEQGLVESRPTGRGNRREYKLTKEGRALIAARRRASDNLGSQARETSLAILAFCFLKGRSRLLLLPKERNELLGTPEKAPIGLHHCLESGVHAKCVHHIYAPAMTTPLTEMLRQTRNHLKAALTVAELAPWIRHDRYVHTILVELHSREADFKALLEESEFDEYDHRLIRDVAPVRVERVPIEADMEEALRGLEKEYQAA